MLKIRHIKFSKRMRYWFVQIITGRLAFMPRCTLTHKVVAIL